MKILGARGVLECRASRSVGKSDIYHVRQYFHNQTPSCSNSIIHSKQRDFSSNINSSFAVKGLWCQTLNFPFLELFRFPHCGLEIMDPHKDSNLTERRLACLLSSGK